MRNAELRKRILNPEKLLFAELGLAALTANCAETLLEFVDTAFGVDELVLAREEGVGIRRDTAGDHIMFDTINDFLLLGAGGRVGDETAAGRNVNKDNRIVFGMDICFHDKRQGLRFRRKRETDFAKIMHFVKSSLQLFPE